MTTRSNQRQRNITGKSPAYVLLLLLLLLHILSCAGKGTGPARSSRVLKSIHVNNCSTLVSYEGNSAAPKTIYTAPQDWYIGSFSYSSGRPANYLVLLSQSADQSTLRTALVRLQPDGTTAALDTLSSCADCEAYRTLGEIHLSPGGRYLAIDKCGWEWGRLAVFDLTSQQFVSFDCQASYDDSGFLLWHPTKNLLYGWSGNSLIEYDIDGLRCRLLPTPNIRDYLTEAELLNQGYVGERIDYERLLGTRWPVIIGWHPNGWHLAYEYEDSLFLFHMKDSSRVLIYSGKFDRRSQHFGVEWDEAEGEITPPGFDNGDIIAAFDSTILDSVTPLNDSIKYVVKKSGPISYLECRWGTRVSTSRYLFRGSATAEKFHIAELDYLLWEFALDLTPRFWFRTSFYSGGYLTDSAYAADYQEMANDYRVALQMFRDFRYPPVLADRAAHYSDLVSLNCRFEATMAAYISNRDRAAFADSLRLLIPGVSAPFMDTILTELEGFQLGDRRKIATAYQALYNRYFNYYGHVIARDVSAILNTYEIETYSDDFVAETSSNRKAGTADAISP